MKEKLLKKTENDPSGVRSSREVWPDILRVAAILAVIAIHTDLGSLYMNMELGSPSYYICLFISMFLSFSPPVFFMISGGLLLGKKESIAEVWKKRVVRMLIILVLISLLYFAFDVIGGLCTADPLEFLRKLYTEARIVPLWYLYAYIAFLITLPFLRGIASVIDEKSGLYLFVLVLVLRYIIPGLEKLSSSPLHMQENLRWDWLMSTVVLYPLLGYWLHAKTDLSRLKKYALPLILLDLAALVFYTALAGGNCVEEGVNALSDSWRGKLNLLHAVTLFVSARILFSRQYGERSRKLWKCLSGCVFGIYLLHGVFLDRIRLLRNIKEQFFSLFSGPALLIPSFLWILVIFGLSFAAVFILKQLWTLLLKMLRKGKTE